MNYSDIKRLAKEQGIKVGDLCALAPSNDPFYTGRPSEIEAANWFADIWHRFGYRDGVHLRRVHYQLVSQDTPARYPHRDYPEGKPYENTDACWSYLVNAGKYARYLDLVRVSAFVDRRNPEAKRFTNWWRMGDPEPDYSVTDPFGDESHDYQLPDLPELPELPIELPSPADYRVSTDSYRDLAQDVHLEIWCEKTTMNDVLIPLCRRYGVNLVTGAGEMSITACYDFMNRVQNSQRRARILYVADFDPAGWGMPVSVARKIEFFQRDREFDGLDIRLQPIVLTEEQVKEYGLPRVPVKDSDRRKGAWVDEHGAGQTELDALEALYPGVLKEIVTAAILGYYDPNLQRNADDKRRELEGALGERREEVIASYEATLDALEDEYSDVWSEFENTRQEFADLVADFQPKIDAHDKALQDILARAGEVHRNIRDALETEGVDVADYPLPEPELPPERGGQLYQSGRDYFTQIEHYNAHRGNGNS